MKGLKIFKKTALKLDKACFGHDTAYSDSKNLAKRTISELFLRFWKIQPTKLL